MHKEPTFKQAYEKELEWKRAIVSQITSFLLFHLETVKFVENRKWQI